MKKIPSLFTRDFDNNPRLVTREYNEGVEWVINCEGVATRKWDGTAVLLLGSGFYKRFDAKHGNCIIPEIAGVGTQFNVLRSRTYDDLKEYLSQTEIEGIVFHHPDGRMAKIKRSDFGFDWPVTQKL